VPASAPSRGCRGRRRWCPPRLPAPAGRRPRSAWVRARRNEEYSIHTSRSVATSTSARRCSRAEPACRSSAISGNW
jgi:hypothetical protein